ncbi:glucose-1-phosphate adenylyltransferase subunit GlgD [Aquibacillus koreensis]|uniref:Glucose-1-phosphate adenylyltransferase subunit GlgD n=1 Tax=Aquibacillus koreensis TaxID=279446 RepID=A0A9X3WMU1_9BACI|nr:glucose-1-phosphate adenylyltransferase subunit GlgD [Aquibacillus koreensis]MCT2534178.1 glucose-1-phosphate adenylyltransferase subunit GlgD [Aquibacillus koreensis]MDC3422570.1 glucose-1-phosphate adenylyltransferase subunit GlgD [Aquibacillus koreensis]
METMMGLINLEHEHDFLNELTYFRCGAAVPFGGRFRMIDFTLSNMAKSNIQEVAIFTRNKYRSLMDHLGSGADWDLDRRHGGLFILPPDWNDPTDISKGDLKYFHNNLDYFERGKSDYVLISGSQFISNTVYDKMFQHHLDRNADVTILTTTYETLHSEHNACIKVVQDEDGWVTCLNNDTENAHIFTGVYILRKSLLLDLVKDCIANHKSHFFLDGIKANLERLNIQTYRYEGYSAIVNSVESYYRQNMALLDTNAYKKLFFDSTPIMTKVGNQPPTKYRGTSIVTKSLIATGCVIDGSVENSILFRGVHVGEGASVKNSIIMQRCKIEPGVHLENVILDKDVSISKEQILKGAKEQPYIIAKRTII